MGKLFLETIDSSNGNYKDLKMLAVGYQKAKTAFYSSEPFKHWEPLGPLDFEIELTT